MRPTKHWGLIIGRPLCLSGKETQSKASVEVLWASATAIIASLRNEVFDSLQSLRMAVRKKLDEFNRKPFQKREYSRWEVFQKKDISTASARDPL